MSPNEDLVRRYIHALNARDDEELRRLVAPSFLDEELAIARKTFDHLDRELTIDRVVERGDLVVGFNRSVLSWKETGEVATEPHFAAVWHIRDGRIVAREVYDDANEALAAAEIDPSG